MREMRYHACSNEQNIALFIFSLLEHDVIRAILTCMIWYLPKIAWQPYRLITTSAHFLVKPRIWQPYGISKPNLFQRKLDQNLSPRIQVMKMGLRGLRITHYYWFALVFQAWQLFPEPRLSVNPPKSSQRSPMTDSTSSSQTEKSRST